MTKAYIHQSYNYYYFQNISAKFSRTVSAILKGSGFNLPIASIYKFKKVTRWYVVRVFARVCVRSFFLSFVRSFVRSFGSI